MKIEQIKVKNTIDACNRLLTIKSGTGSLVLVTLPLYEELKKVGSKYNISYKHWYSGQPTQSPVENFRVYDIHSLHCTKLSLLDGTAWVVILGIDAKEFTGTKNDEIYIFEI